MFLGIDLGTSSIKIVILDAKQQVVASAQTPLKISHPQPLWSEQHPHDWWQATEDAMQQLQHKHSKLLKEITAIGLTGQMHGAVLLDIHNQVLRPAILWNDGRAYAECELIKQRLPNALEICGNQIMPGFTAPKLLWIQKYEPDIFSKVNKVLLPKDYLRFCLSGDFATDLSDASGTAWLNVAKRQWSDELLAATNLNRQHMPELYEGIAVTGVVTAELASKWGLAKNTKIIAGGGDNAASAIAMNVIKPGNAFLSLGTSGVYFIADDRYRANPAAALHTMCHCLPAKWHHMSVQLNAASVLAWWARVCDQPVTTLLKEVSEREDADTSILCLPYLSGERTPYNNPYARGVFFGMDNQTERFHLTQAVLEGVAFACRAGQKSIQAAGIAINETNVIGGGAQSLYWGNILANILNQELIYRQDREASAAVGAARLAWYAMMGGDLEQVFLTSPVEQRISPEEKLSSRYDKKFQRYEQLYQALIPIFKG